MLHQRGQTNSEINKNHKVPQGEKSQKDGEKTQENQLPWKQTSWQREPEEPHLNQDTLVWVPLSTSWSKKQAVKLAATQETEVKTPK